MAKTYGADLRGRVIAAAEGGLSRRATAERFQVGIPTAIKWVRAWRHHGRSIGFKVHPPAARVVERFCAWNGVLVRFE